MLSKNWIIFAALTASIDARSISTSSLQARDNNCGEKAAKVCYGAPLGVSQNVDLEDVAYVAAYLRYYGQTQSPPAMLTIPSTNQFECAEWSIYEAGTVLVLAKHIDPRVKTSVLFEDIANTIDGGEAGPAVGATDYILNCGINGGSLGVKVNATRPEYNTPEYIASGAKTAGIAIKIVKAAG
ncbi:hypothetical protein IFR05_016744 [Cadophora sp. M221]|nr:hypothetical protein IFR05_016744 [Cadophora sp. M221]